jgi:hypothetical protein
VPEQTSPGRCGLAQRPVRNDPDRRVDIGHLLLETQRRFREELVARAHADGYADLRLPHLTARSLFFGASAAHAPEFGGSFGR